jgi:hypothetical protein
METRIKWLQSSALGKVLLEGLETALRRNAFTKSLPRGFILERTRNDAIAGKYIERVEGKKNFTDPFGNTVELPTLNFDTTEFRISSGNPQLEFINPTRALKRLLILLGELADFGLSVQEVQVDVLRWATLASRSIGRLELNEVVYRDVTVTGSTAATIAFFGGANVQKDAAAFIGKRGHAVSRVTGSVRVGLRQYHCSFVESGRFTISPEPDPQVVRVVRESLAEATAP